MSLFLTFVIVDMVAAEAVRRLHFGFGTQFADIDETGILPVAIVERPERKGLLHMLTQRYYLRQDFDPERGLVSPFNCTETCFIGQGLSCLTCHPYLEPKCLSQQRSDSVSMVSATYSVPILIVLSLIVQLTVRTVGSWSFHDAALPGTTVNMDQRLKKPENGWADCAKWARDGPCGYDCYKHASNQAEVKI